MANPMFEETLSLLPPKKYSSIRKDLKTGDLIFCSGNYLFSSLIKKFTKSVWSHVGVIYKDEKLDRILVLESEKIYGVRFAPLSKYLKDYHGNNKPYSGKIVVARVMPEISQNTLNKVISFGMDELTKPYDNWEIIRMAFRIIFKVSKREKNRDYICSELIQASFKAAGIRFKDNSTKISPDDIWLDNHVQFLWRLL